MKLGIRLFNQQEKMHLEITCKQLVKKCQSYVEVTPLFEAEAVVISPKDPGFENYLEAYRQGKVAKPLVYSETNNNYPYFLQKPVTLDILRQTVTSLSNQKPAGNDQYTTGVLSKLQSLQATGQSQALVQQQKNILIYDAKSLCFRIHEAFVSANRLDEVIVSAIKQAITLPLSDEQLKKIQVSPDYKKISVDQLFWQMAFLQTQVPTIDNTKVFQLHRWPNFSKLGYSNEHLRMTATLIKAPITIDSLHQQYHIPVNAIRRFISACDAIGLLKDNVQVQENAKRSKKIVEPIVQKIFDRFFGKKAY